MIVFSNMIVISTLNVSIVWLKWQITIPENNTVRRNLIIELAESLAGILSEESQPTSSAQSISDSQMVIEKVI